MSENTVAEAEMVIDFKLGEFVDLVCCDCGLTHVMKPYLENGTLKIEWWRNERSTGQYRRYRDYPLLK